MVMEGIQEDMGDGSMVCADHPYKNSTPGGICAFCLQEKLGKLVSSSFPSAIFPSSSSSSTPSFRSDIGGVGSGNNGGGGNGSATSASAAKSLSLHTHNISSPATKMGISDCSSYNPYYTSRRSRIPFLLTHQRRRKKKEAAAMAIPHEAATSIVFKRSKSTTTPRRNMHFQLDAADDYSPHKRGFWSFLYSSSKNPTSKKTEHSAIHKDSSFSSSTATLSSSGGASINGNASSISLKSKEKKKEDFIVVDETESPDQAAFDRKVSRSRSVGCGSRSFSGDFFERISTGFGDCTLRRVESQREGKPRVPHRSSAVNGQDCIKERVKCGGIFSGFMINSSSSSSSSSSYWVASSTEENVNGKPTLAPSSVGHQHQLSHGRSRSWGWAFASPMRAFSSKPSSSSASGAGKRSEAANKNVTPNLSAIPSLLTVRG